MREVEVSRAVSASPVVVRRALTPESVVESEGTFTVLDVTPRDDATMVTAGARGLELSLRFEASDDGLYYTQVGGEGPFESMETWVTVAEGAEGSVVTMRSAVSLGLPFAPLSDRLAAWKRRGELERALASLTATVE